MPPSPEDPLALALIADEILACVAGAMGSDAPACRVVLAGPEVPWDNCCEGGGQLTTHIRRVYPSERFPSQSTAEFNCRTLGLVVEVVVTHLRCGSVDCVCCPATELVSEAVHRAGYAILRGLLCCFASWASVTTSRRQAALSEQRFLSGGGCAGSETVVLVALPALCC